MDVTLNAKTVTLTETDACLVFRTNGKSEVFLATSENGPLTEDSPEFSLAVCLKLFMQPKARTIGALMVATELNRIADEEKAA